MVFTIKPLPIATSSGTRTVLSVTPCEHLIADRHKLEELREAGGVSSVDQLIEDAIRDQVPGAHLAFLFCGESPEGNGSWRLSDDLDAAECTEMAFHLFRSQLPLNRLCAAHGMFDNVYIGWKAREIEAFTAGTERLAAEIRADGPLHPTPDTPAARLRRLNLWLVERHTFYQSVSLADDSIAKILGPRLLRAESRRASLSRMLDGLPPGCLDG